MAELAPIWLSSLTMKREIVEARYAETVEELNKARADAMAVLVRAMADSHERYLAAVEALSADDGEAIERHRLALAEFRGLRWKVTVQREAIGLADHGWVDRTYPLAAVDRRPDEITEAQRRMMQYRMSR